MNQPKKSRLRVSDHAFGRYAERVLGLDRDEVMTEIRRLVGPAVELCSSCRVPFRAGDAEFIAVVENRTVLTIVPKHAPNVPCPHKTSKRLLPKRHCDLLDAVDTDSPRRRR